MKSSFLTSNSPFISDGIGIVSFIKGLLNGDILEGVKKYIINLHYTIINDENNNTQRLVWLMNKMTNREKKEVKEGKEDCPLSTTDWVMFLSNEIDRTERDQPPIMTALIAAILAIMGVGVTIAVMRIPESLYYHKLMFLFIISIFIVFFWILSFVILLWFKKKVEPFENLRRRIILGKEKDCIKIRDEWRDIVSKKRFKFI